MTTIPALVADAIELEGWRDLFRAAPAATARELGLEISAAGTGALLSSTGIDHLLFNRCIGIGGSDARLTGGAVEALRHFERRGIDRFLLHVAAGAHPRGETLRRLGLEPYRRRWVKLAREGGVPPEPVETPLAIGPARADEAESCARMLAAGFDMPEPVHPILAALVGRPRWHVLVARDGERPVAVGVLFVHGNVGYLAFAATRPSHRRRRAQRALMVERLRIASALGCQLVVTETGEAIGSEPKPSFENMLRCGFAPIAIRENYTLPGTTWLRATKSSAA